MVVAGAELLGGGMNASRGIAWGSDVSGGVGGYSCACLARGKVDAVQTEGLLVGRMPAL